MLSQTNQNRYFNVLSYDLLWRNTLLRNRESKILEKSTDGLILDSSVGKWMILRMMILILISTFLVTIRKPFLAHNRCFFLFFFLAVINYLSITLRVKCPYSELFWSILSRIWREYREMLQFECGEIRTKIIPNMDFFYTV